MSPGRSVPKKHFLLLLFLFVGASAFAFNREEHPWTFRFNAGDPAPSFIGAGLGYHLNEYFEVQTSMGVSWIDEISAQTFAGGLKFYWFPTRFTPFVGVAASYVRFSGEGSVQGLDGSTFLGNVNAGLDLTLESVRISAGYAMHFPVHLLFPFIDFGIVF